MLEEIWKDIKDYEGIYQVSNLGRIRNIEYNWLKAPSLHKGKYLRIQLYKDGKCKYCRVHRLVAEAFIPNPDNKKEINHKDLNASNNNVDNLEWINSEDNITHYMNSDKYRNYLPISKKKKLVHAYQLEKLLKSISTETDPIYTEFINYTLNFINILKRNTSEY
jgi:hypothetical protein